MKSMNFIRILGVVTVLAGAASAQTERNERTGTDAGKGQQVNDSNPPGTPPGTPTKVPVSRDERGWRQTQEEADAARRSEGARKEKARNLVEDEYWIPARTDLPDRDAMRDGDANRNGRNLTAQDAGTSVGDREIARQTRRAVVSDKSLSTAAHNVKIISRGGTVTLKGRVDNEAEKQNIAEKTAAIVGAENVVNKLTVKTPRKSKSYGGNP